ncbi:MAG: hypothetical protein OWS74_00585 [Firmicutes bacterium]|nr:hypothetical protein [Bacillota bacterium]
MQEPILWDFPDHFETPRLIIRSYHYGDGPALYTALKESVTELKPWLPWVPDVPQTDDCELSARTAHIHF